MLKEYTFRRKVLSFVGYEEATMTGETEAEARDAIADNDHLWRVYTEDVEYGPVRCVEVESATAEGRYGRGYR